jgi:hypothetical protein
VTRSKPPAEPQTPLVKFNLYLSLISGFCQGPSFPEEPMELSKGIRHNERDALEERRFLQG